MGVIAATELAPDFRQPLERLAVERQEVVIEGNRRQVARLVSVPGHQTTPGAMADLYRTPPEEAARGWHEAAREALGRAVEDEVRDPWDT